MKFYFQHTVIFFLVFAKMNLFGDHTKNYEITSLEPSQNQEKLMNDHIAQSNIIGWGWGTIVIREPDNTISLYESINNNTSTRQGVQAGRDIAKAHLGSCDRCERGINKGNVIFSPTKGSRLWVWDRGTCHAHEPSLLFSKKNGIVSQELEKYIEPDKTYFDACKYILFSTGVDGLLGVNEAIISDFEWTEIVQLSNHESIKIAVTKKGKSEKVLIIGRTPEIIKMINELLNNGISDFVAFIHTTC